MKKVLSNFFYQGIFQVTKLIIPFVTIPIVSRILGPNGIGIYNYTYSISQYFVLFSTLGVSLYGNREISIVRCNTIERSKTFWEIFLMKSLVTVINICLFLFLCKALDIGNYLILHIFSLLAVFFDITWFFMGMEDFKKVSLANIVSQILTFISIIIFIKKDTDIFKYICIQSIGLLIPNFITWILVRKYITLTRINIKNIYRHLLSTFKYFIPQVAIILYTNLNKTLLGIFDTTTYVAYYSNAIQVNAIFISLITTIDTVLMPKMTFLIHNKKENDALNIMKQTIVIELFVSIAMMFGLLTIFDNFIPWFFGNEFLFINNIMPWLSVLIVIVPLGTAVSRQYLLPKGNTKDYTISVLIGAIVSVVLNIILLPAIGIYGVVIANISAELFVTTSRLLPILKNTSFKLPIKDISKFMIMGASMCVLTRLITRHMTSSFSTILIQIIIGASIYIFLSFVLKVNPIFNLWYRKRSNVK